MKNNDIIRRIRYVFDFSDTQMINLFGAADYEVTRTQVSNWMKKEENPAFVPLHDKEMAIFLNGFINEKRGRREGEQPKPEKRLTNNMILRKLKIALNLKDQDMLDIFKLAGVRLSKHELSAFFRKPTQSQYRLCKDQFLRNFIYGMQLKYRDKVKIEPKKVKEKKEDIPNKTTFTGFKLTRIKK